MLPLDEQLHFTAMAQWNTVGDIDMDGLTSQDFADLKSHESANILAASIVMKAKDDGTYGQITAGSEQTDLDRPSALASQGPTKGKHQRRKSVIVACQRCRYRKIRCDGVQPSCKNCVKAKVECIVIEKPVEIPRSHLNEMEERIHWLERIVRQNVPEIDLESGPPISFRSDTSRGPSIYITKSDSESDGPAYPGPPSPMSMVSPTSRRPSSGSDYVQPISPISPILDFPRGYAGNQQIYYQQNFAPFQDLLSPPFSVANRTEVPLRNMRRSLPCEPTSLGTPGQQLSIHRRALSCESVQGLGYNISQQETQPAILPLLPPSSYIGSSNSGSGQQFRHVEDELMGYGSLNEFSPGNTTQAASTDGWLRVTQVGTQIMNDFSWMGSQETGKNSQ